MLTRIYKEDKDALKEYLMSRTQDLSTDVLVTVSNIIQDVKENKDEACKWIFFAFSLSLPIVLNKLE